MWSSSARWMLPSDVPVDPSASAARDWARTELARAVYHQTPSLWDRFWTWVAEFLRELLTGMPAGGSWLMPAVLVGAFAVAIALVLWLGGRVQRSRHPAGRPSVALFPDQRSSRDLRADAERAERVGDLASAFLDRFRAIIRSLDERGVLEDMPGMTAHEAALAAGAALVGLAPEWDWSAATFDAVCYGTRRPGGADLARLRALDDAAAHAPAAHPAQRAPVAPA